VCVAGPIDPREEVPLIVVGFLVAATAALAATAMLKGTRMILRLTGLDRPTATKPAY
jgi:hypothetical protein